jgi:GNAT superfamily N-acetyltransferase
MIEIDRPAAPSLLVRVISCEDAASVAALSAQLGYEISIEAIEEHIGRLSACAGSQVAFVACMGTVVVGWIEAAITHHLQSAPHSLITGLVVRDGMRGFGVGKRLCAEVEAWSREQGIVVLRVTSRMSREGAHRFYLREGFQQTKTSAVFEKILL